MLARTAESGFEKLLLLDDETVVLAVGFRIAARRQQHRKKMQRKYWVFTDTPRSGARLMKGGAGQKPDYSACPSLR
jgi:hypothetical protein